MLAYTLHIYIIHGIKYGIDWDDLFPFMKAVQFLYPNINVHSIPNYLENYLQ